MRADAASSVSSLPSGVKIAVGTGGPALGPMMWMFLAILITSLITRTVTRLIRSGSGAGLGNVHITGNHVHHQVFGILIIIGTGIVLVSATPHGAALSAAAAVFGVGVGLTVNEVRAMAAPAGCLLDHRGAEIRNAIFCVLAITGALIGGASFLSGPIGATAWWSSVAVLAVDLLLCVICLLKGKVVTGMVGMVLASSPSSAR